MNSFKKFDKKLYDETNDKAINKAIEVLTEKYFFKSENIDRTEAYKSHDFIIYDISNNSFKIEVEIRQAWKTKSFLYPTVQFPYRKKNSHSDIFIIFNYDLSAALINWDFQNLIQTAKTVVKNTKWTFAETFFECGILEFEYIEI